MKTEWIDGDEYEFTDEQYKRYLACVEKTGDKKKCAKEHGQPVKPKPPKPKI